MSGYACDSSKGKRLRRESRRGRFCSGLDGLGSVEIEDTMLSLFVIMEWPAPLPASKDGRVKGREEEQADEDLDFGYRSWEVQLQHRWL